jgi:hypothetical protein
MGWQLEASLSIFHFVSFLIKYGIVRISLVIHVKSLLHNNIPPIVSVFFWDELLLLFSPEYCDFEAYKGFL